MSPLEDACRAHLTHLEVRQYSPVTIANRRGRLRRFNEWAASIGIDEPKAVTRKVLLAYQRHLFRVRKKNGKPLSAGSQINHLVALKTFFKWLTRQGDIDANPAADLEMPKVPRRLPRDVLTFEEAEQIFAVVDTSTIYGVRDRTILEVFFATGLRRSELMNLDVFDVDENREQVFVREGKGKKDRIVPIGARALGWIARYKMDVRPKLAFDDEQALFLAQGGSRISGYTLSQIVRTHVQQSGISKSGSCHLFRHTMATLMLENGADVRFVQEMLGHAKLTTTQIYTRVSIRKLQEIYNATHPGSKC